MTTAKMNNMQQIALNNVVNYVLYGDVREVKRLEVKDNEFDRDVYVSLEVGFKDDEDNLGSIFRDCYCFSIGTKGGIYTFEGSGQSIRKAYKKYYELKSIW